MFCLCGYMCTTCEPDALRCHKKALDSLGLELRRLSVAMWVPGIEPWSSTAATVPVTIKPTAELRSLTFELYRASAALECAMYSLCTRSQHPCSPSLRISCTTIFTHRTFSIKLTLGDTSFCSSYLFVCSCFVFICVREGLSNVAPLAWNELGGPG